MSVAISVWFRTNMLHVPVLALAGAGKTRTTSKISLYTLYQCISVVAIAAHRLHTMQLQHFGSGLAALGGTNRHR